MTHIKPAEAVNSVNWWIVIILLGALAMAVGPVMMLQLNAGDRHREAIRRRARELGLRVSLETLPRQATDLETPQRIPVYRLPVARGEGSPNNWQVVRAAYRHESQLLGEWRWQGRARPSAPELHCLEAGLTALPASVSSVGGDPRGWYLFWRESGDLPSVDSLANFLRKLRDCNLSRASTRG